MKLLRHSPALFLLLALLLGLSSCFVLDGDFLLPLRELTGHERAVVSIPATIGAVAGGAAGVPLVILGLPVTLPVAITSDVDMAMVLPLAPALAVAEFGAILVGGPAWLLFGWW